MNRLFLQTPQGAILEALLNEYYSEVPDVEATLKVFDKELTQHVMYVAGYGVSHRSRPVQFGAVAVARMGSRLIVPEGRNMSPYKGAVKYCAELALLDAGDAMAAQSRPPRPEYGGMATAGWQIMKAYVAGTTKPGDNLEINLLDAPTVHPCGTPCRQRLLSHQAVQAETEFVTLAVDLDKQSVEARESHTLDEFVALYDGVTPPLVSRELAG